MIVAQAYASLRLQTVVHDYLTFDSKDGKDPKNGSVSRITGHEFALMKIASFNAENSYCFTPHKSSTSEFQDVLTHIVHHKLPKDDLYDFINYDEKSVRGYVNTTLDRYLRTYRKQTSIQRSFVSLDAQLEADGGEGSTATLENQLYGDSMANALYREDIHAESYPLLVEKFKLKLIALSACPTIYSINILKLIAAGYAKSRFEEEQSRVSEVYNKTDRTIQQTSKSHLASVGENPNKNLKAYLNDVLRIMRENNHSLYNDIKDFISIAIAVELDFLTIVGDELDPVFISRLLTTRKKTLKFSYQQYPDYPIQSSSDIQRMVLAQKAALPTFSNLQSPANRMREEEMVTAAALREIEERERNLLHKHESTYLRNKVNGAQIYYALYSYIAKKNLYDSDRQGFVPQKFGVQQNCMDMYAANPTSLLDAEMDNFATSDPVLNWTYLHEYQKYFWYITRYATKSLDKQKKIFTTELNINPEQKNTGAEVYKQLVRDFGKESTSEQKFDLTSSGFMHAKNSSGLYFAVVVPTDARCASFNYYLVRELGTLLDMQTGKLIFDEETVKNLIMDSLQRFGISWRV